MQTEFGEFGYLFWRSFVESSKPVRRYFVWTEKAFSVEFSPRRENSAAESVFRSLVLETSLQTDNGLPRMLKFVYYSYMQQ